MEIAVKHKNSAESKRTSNSSIHENFSLKEGLRQNLISTLVSYLPNKESLSLEDLESLGIFGSSCRQNLYILRDKKKGPKWHFSTLGYRYPKKDFIQWLYDSTKFKIGEYK